MSRNETQLVSYANRKRTDLRTFTPVDIETIYIGVQKARNVSLFGHRRQN